MTEDEKTELTEETGAATDKAADSTDAQTQTEAKADAEAPERDTGNRAPETETATEQKDGRKLRPLRRLKTALPRPMTNYCGHSPNWKTRGGAPIATARGPQIRSRELCPRHAGGCR